MTSASPDPASDSPSPGLRILVADDGKSAADMLGLFFELEGHVVRVVYDGQAALDAVPDFRPDLAILDLSMPGMDGLQAAKRIRELDEGRGLRLFALSGGIPEEDAALARDAGFDGHLAKPVTPDDLRRFLAGLGPA